MNKNNEVILTVAKMLGGIALGMYIFFIVRNFPDMKGIFNNSLRSMLLLWGFAAAGYIFSFFQRKEGGVVMTFTSIILGLNIFYQGVSGATFIPLIMAVFFLISGIIFWYTDSKYSK